MAIAAKDDDSHELSNTSAPSSFSIDEAEETDLNDPLTLLIALEDEAIALGIDTNYYTTEKLK